MANPLKMLKLKPAGFQFIQELPVQAPPAKVWRSLLNVGKWFRFEGREMPKHALEPWAGGRWYTKSADGTTGLLGLVTLIEPGKLMRISGTFGQSHLPVLHAFIFELQPRDGGKSTMLRFGQRTHGLVDADLKGRMQGGWGQLLPNLKALAEKR